MKFQLDISLEDLQAQYLSDGRIELVSSDDDRFKKYEALGMILTNTSRMLLEADASKRVVQRLNKTTLLILTSGKEGSNIGMLNSIANKLYPIIKEKL